MTLEDALDKLKHQEAFQLVAEEIKQRLDDKVRELPTADVGQIDRDIGQIAVYQEILDIFTSV